MALYSTVSAYTYTFNSIEECKINTSYISLQLFPFFFTRIFACLHKWIRFFCFIHWKSANSNTDQTWWHIYVNVQKYSTEMTIKTVSYPLFPFLYRRGRNYKLLSINVIGRSSRNNKHKNVIHFNLRRKK